MSADSTPTLTLCKTMHSVHPWRIGLMHTDGRFEAIPHLTFARKRDAVPVLTALQVLTLDWDLHPQTWTTAVWDAVRALVEACPGWQVYNRAVAQDLADRTWSRQAPSSRWLELRTDTREDTR